MNYKKGELVALSEGEYSDYCVKALVRVLVDFDAREMLLAWAKDAGIKPVRKLIYSPQRREEVQFIGWLNRSGLIEDVQYRELHMGSYGETELAEVDVNRWALGL